MKNTTALLAFLLLMNGPAVLPAQENADIQNMFVTPEMEALFDKAMTLYNDREYDDALSAWDELYALLGYDSESTIQRLIRLGSSANKVLDLSFKGLAAPEQSASRDEDDADGILLHHFGGLALMYRAWLYMDLLQYDKAKKLLEATKAFVCLFQFDTVEMYDFYFSYANTLGSLGDTEHMAEEFGQAFLIAANMLDDEEKAFNSRKALFIQAYNNKSWALLEKESLAAAEYAGNNGLALLRITSVYYHALASINLGKTNQAEESLLSLKKLGDEYKLPEVSSRAELMLSELK